MLSSSRCVFFFFHIVVLINALYIAHQFPHNIKQRTIYVCNIEDAGRKLLRNLVTFTHRCCITK